MKTLADEIVEALPAMMVDHPLGPMARDIARHLAADEPRVRAAMLEIGKAERAIYVRRKGGRAFYLLPFGYPIRACKNCHVEFERPRKSRRMCCSRSCGVAWSWRLPGVAEKRQEGILAERQTPKAKARVERFNKKRWSNPEQRRRLSEWNKRRWADPVENAKLSAAIQARHGSLENREAWSKLRKAMWADPEYRAKHMAALRRRAHKFIYRGRELTLGELEALSGIDRRTLYHRLITSGMTVERALVPRDHRFKQAA